MYFFYHTAEQSRTVNHTATDVDTNEVLFSRVVTVIRDQRITFCGRFEEDKKTIEIGVSLCNGKDIFSKKKGRAISKHRADCCPLIRVQIDLEHMKNENKTPQQIFIDACNLHAKWIYKNKVVRPIMGSLKVEAFFEKESSSALV